MMSPYSTDILKVRHETLYIIALAAGLLSEQAYAFVTRHAKQALTTEGERGEERQVEKKE